MKISFETIGTLSSLLVELERAFPNVIPINNLPSIEDFRKLQGQQEVIQFIRMMLPDDDDPLGHGD